MNVHWSWSLTAWLAVLLVSQAAWAGDIEYITNYHSEITVHPDATMSVTETIAVMVRGFEIKHGIYRDFPTKYKTSEGNTVTVWFELEEVRRNGVPEPYEVTGKANGVSVRIGSGDVYLEHGEHVYTIRYKTSRQLGFFDNCDELYWNVTGNGWGFVINHASAEVILPDGVDMDQVRTVAYTGPYGGHGADYVASVSGSRASFDTTSSLGRYEGLTIVVQWPPGVVSRPTRAELAQYWLVEHLVVLLCLVSVLVVLLYYYIAWLGVGVDPHGGFIVPESSPPNGLSPAALRYITSMSADRKCFTATLVSMASRGYLTITDDAGEYVLTKTGENVDKLAPEEAALGQRLFGRTNQRRINQDSRTTLVNAQAALRKSLRQQYDGVYFNRNSRQLQVGLTLSIVLGVVTIAAMMVPHTGFPVGVLLLAGVCHFVMYGVFSMLMPAYTWLGRAFLDRIKGFKLALSGGIDDLGEEHFGSGVLVEEYLPYAIALEVHTQWSRRFEQALRLRQQRLGQAYTSYHPIWYMGDWADFDTSGSSGFSRFSSEFTSSFNSQISSASTPPSSSSGGGGGGFSGGGGGGGGGGGW